MLCDLEKSMRMIDNECDKVELNVYNYFKGMNIYVDDNLEETEELIENIMKRKLCKILRNRMKDNLDACQNMESFVNNYFDSYDIAERIEHLASMIEGWIHFIQDTRTEKRVH